MATTCGPSPVELAATGRSRFAHALAPLTVRGVEFANRLFFASMGVDLAGHDGSLAPELIEFMEGMVQSGCGAVMFGNASVSRDSMLRPRALHMFAPQHVPPLKRFIATAAERGVVAGIQLQHYGGQGTTTFTRGRALLTPSGIGSKSVARLDPRYQVRTATLEDIAQVQRQFACSAALCRAAGARLVQLQASNGYLLGSFLSKYTNRRLDDYGGSPARRARMVVETVRSVRQVLGSEVVLGLRIGIDDGLGPEGLVPEDLRETIPELEAAGVDLFEASFYVADTFDQLAGAKPDLVASLHEKVALVRSFCRVPLGFAGFVAGLAAADSLLASGTADMIGMARALFADNDLILKSVAEREAEIHRCLWDGKCFKDKSDPRFDRVYCCVNPKYRRPA